MTTAPFLFHVQFFSPAQCGRIAEGVHGTQQIAEFLLRVLPVRGDLLRQPDKREDLLFRVVSLPSALIKPDISFGSNAISPFNRVQQGSAQPRFFSFS